MNGVIVNTLNGNKADLGEGEGIVKAMADEYRNYEAKTKYDYSK